MKKHEFGTKLNHPLPTSLSKSQLTKSNFRFDKNFPVLKTSSTKTGQVDLRLNAPLNPAVTEKPQIAQKSSLEQTSSETQTCSISTSEVQFKLTKKSPLYKLPWKKIHPYKRYIKLASC